VEQSLEVEPTGAIRKANGRKAGALERGTATGKGKASKGSCADEEGRYRNREEPATQPETRRTPGSAAGCNKPARQHAEQTTKTVRNREGGTGLDPWQGRAETRTSKWPTPTHEPTQELTRAAHVDGGAIFENPKRGAW
jgi:hypothetical protein